MVNFSLLTFFFTVKKSKMLVIARFNKSAHVMLTYYTNKKLPVSENIQFCVYVNKVTEIFKLACKHQHVRFWVFFS